MRAHDARTANATPFLTRDCPSWLAGPAHGSRSSPSLGRRIVASCRILRTRAGLASAKIPETRGTETMRRIVRDYQIKTVLALAHPPEHRLAVQERDLARELGIRWVHVPIVDHRGTKDRVAEEAISDLLDQAAAVVADPANYPIFFHC